jgi:hypothetical protein
LSEACGHITGLLYQIAKYKMLNLRTLPEDVAKTSQPQAYTQRRKDQRQRSSRYGGIWVEEV